MLEPYAVKVARTVPRGGKSEMINLSQLDLQVILSSKLNKRSENEEELLNIGPETK